LTQATGKLLGRTTAGTGATEEISVGGSLSLSSGALNVSSISLAQLSQSSATAGQVVTWNGSAWTAQAPATGVSSFNTRTGAITLSSSDVTTALTYTPVNKAGDIMTGNLTVPAVVMQTPFAFRNKIINGAMVIDQRNAGASVTGVSGTNVFPVDRWFNTSTQNSKLTLQQNAGSVTPPSGYRNYVGVTSSSSYSVLTSDAFTLSHRIEGYNTADLMWGTASAQTVTLSFWVRSSLTGTFGGAFGNNAINRSYPFTYTINVANTWEQKTITIAGDTTGTWLTTNLTGISIYFGLGAGSTYSGTAGSWASAAYLTATGATSIVGTNGATFYLTGVQLEVGSVATPFEHRLYGQELALCQRYYASSGGFTEYHVVPAPNATFLGVYRVNMPVPMRTDPTLTPNYSASNAISAYGWYTMNRNYSVHYITASVSTNAYMFFTWTANAEL
jgi:hypothetical protein